MILPIVAGAAAVVAAGYNTMAPRSQLYGRTFVGDRRQSRRLALTFDDGPNDPHTYRLLEVLERHTVKATFFMIGNFVRHRPEIAHVVSTAGHVIANHTMTHPNLIFRGHGDVRKELMECERAFDDAGISHAALFRPPHGGRTPAVLRTARSLGLEPVMWSVSGWDWNPHAPEKIVSIVRKQIAGGDVILLHDGGHKQFGTDRAATVRATDLMLERFSGEGYEFATIAEMMNSSQL